MRFVCAYVYVCVRVCTNVNKIMCVSVFMCMYDKMTEIVCVYMHVCVCVHVLCVLDCFLQVCTSKCEYVCVFKCARVRVYVRACV